MSFNFKFFFQPKVQTLPVVRNPVKRPLKSAETETPIRRPKSSEAAAANRPIKNPSAPMKNPAFQMKNPSVPMKNSLVPMKHPSVPMKHPSVPLKNLSAPMKNPLFPMKHPSFPMMVEVQNNVHQDGVIFFKQEENPIHEVDLFFDRLDITFKY